MPTVQVHEASQVYWCVLSVGEECPVAFLPVCEPLQNECVACACVGVDGVFSGLNACHVVCLVTLKELNRAYSCKIELMLLCLY